jgi:hypothetical protein
MPKCAPSAVDVAALRASTAASPTASADDELLPVTILLLLPRRVLLSAIVRCSPIYSTSILRVDTRETLV